MLDKEYNNLTFNTNHGIKVYLQSIEKAEGGCNRVTSTVGRLYNFGCTLDEFVYGPRYLTTVCKIYIKIFDVL